MLSALEPLEGPSVTLRRPAGAMGSGHRALLSGWRGRRAILVELDGEGGREATLRQRGHLQDPKTAPGLDPELVSDTQGVTRLHRRAVPVHLSADTSLC